MPTFLTNDDVKLNFTDEGSGSPILLVGGFAMAASAWALQRQHLAEHHRVLCLDRRSHGASDYPNRGHRMSRHGKDLRDFIEALDLREVMAVGASMGASVIWAYVDLFGTDRLRGIVSLDQTPKMINDDGWEWGLKSLKRDGVEEFVANFPGGHSPFFKVPPMEVIELLMKDRVDVPLDELRPLIRDHALADWRDVLSLIDVPVLAIAGRHSPLWPCESSAFVAEQAKDGRIVILEESGHAPFLEEPDAVNKELAAFAK